MAYKLNVQRDVDTDEPGVYILNLPGGWRFNHEPMDRLHTWAYDSMRELRADIKHSVVSCDCAECLDMIKRGK